MPESPRYYEDFTGCGNTLNMRQPQVLQLIMDSLRYWVLDMHVDGFRFDLASALARELFEVDRLSAFFDVIHQDPVLSQVKLIAEPWDLGEGGYQVGNFPVHWTEWNGRYRDTVRRFWRGDGDVVPELATRISGSRDLYETSGRRPYASINFITAHDGFTLRDLVSYNEKHNEANLEGNRDGESHNLSWNCGLEGPTDDPVVRTLRARQQRNLLATLLLSQGVPMISGGDEVGRTQLGNNNAYCQDSELTWTHWDLDADQEAAARLHAAPDPAAPDAARPPAPEALPRSPHPRRRRQGHRLAGAVRDRDAGQGVDRRVRPVPGGAAAGARHRGAGRAGRADSGRDAAHPAQRPLRAGSVQAAIARPPAPVASRAGHVRFRGPGAALRAAPPLSARGAIARGARARRAPEAGCAAAGPAPKGGTMTPRQTRGPWPSPFPAATGAAEGFSPARVIVERVLPQVNCGRFPIKRAVGDTVVVTAHVYADGHDVLRAVLWHRRVAPDMPEGVQPGTVRAAADPDAVWTESPLELLGNDEWRGRFEVEVVGRYEYGVTAWVDPFETWRRELEAKSAAGQDVSSELLEGARLVGAAAARAAAVAPASGTGVAHSPDLAFLRQRAEIVGGGGPQAAAIREALDDRLRGLMARYDGRPAAVSSAAFGVTVERLRARFGAWYEMFPRSAGTDATRGATLREAEARLAAIADLGFDVLYLPPVHPIGRSFRKGANNSLTAGPEDPGSPWAIGSEAGGHKAVDPSLGTIEDFDHFVAAAARLGLEVAIDIAFQCSPDHPYVRDPPRMVPPPAGRHDQVRREPAQEVSGHLPVRLRVRRRRPPCGRN